MSADILVGLTIAGLTILFAFAASKLVLLLVEGMITARDALRDHLGAKHRQSHWLDLVLFPTWLAVELVCLVGAILGAMVMVWIAYDSARQFRDWWHSGPKK